MSKGRKRWITQLKKRVGSLPPSAFLCNLGPQRTGWCPSHLHPYWWEQILAAWLAVSSLSRDWTCTPCSGSVESYPLDDQGSPRGWFSLLSLLTEMFISSRSTLPNISRNVLSASWASVKLVKLTHKIYHRTCLSFSKGSFVEQAALFVLWCSPGSGLCRLCFCGSFICPTTLCIGSCPLYYPVFPGSSSYLPCSRGTQVHSRCGWQLTGFSWYRLFLQ